MSPLFKPSPEKLARKAEKLAQEAEAAARLEAFKELGYKILPVFKMALGDLEKSGVFPHHDGALFYDESNRDCFFIAVSKHLREGVAEKLKGEVIKAARAEGIEASLVTYGGDKDPNQQTVITIPKDTPAEKTQRLIENIQRQTQALMNKPNFAECRVRAETIEMATEIADEIEGFLEHIRNIRQEGHDPSGSQKIDRGDAESVLTLLKELARHPDFPLESSLAKRLEQNIGTLSRATERS